MARTSGDHQVRPSSSSTHWPKYAAVVSTAAPSSARAVPPSAPRGCGSRRRLVERARTSRLISERCARRSMVTVTSWRPHANGKVKSKRSAPSPAPAAKCSKRPWKSRTAAHGATSPKKRRPRTSCGFSRENAASARL